MDVGVNRVAVIERHDEVHIRIQLHGLALGVWGIGVSSPNF
jgi:hypothetical protein